MEYATLWDFWSERSADVEKYADAYACLLVDRASRWKNMKVWNKEVVSCKTFEERTHCSRGRKYIDQQDHTGISCPEYIVQSPKLAPFSLASTRANFDT